MEVNRSSLSISRRTAYGLEPVELVSQERVRLLLRRSGEGCAGSGQDHPGGEV